MAKVDFRNIEKVAGRSGDRAVIAGTRIPVSLILWLTRDGMSVEEIVEAYPHLRRSDVHDALAYAYDHLDEIEEDLASGEESAVMKEWPGGTGPA